MDTRLDMANRQAEGGDPLALVIDAVLTLDVAIVLWDENLGYVFGNQKYRDYFFPGGLPDQGEHAVDILRRMTRAGGFRLAEGETEEAFVARIEAAIRGYAKNVQIDLSDGQSYSASVHATGMGGYLISFTDITEQMRAQAEAEALRLSTERANVRLRDALESIGEGFALFDRDDRLILANDLYRSANPAAAHLMTAGRPRRDIIEAMATGGDIVGVEDWIASYDRESGVGDTSSPRRYEVHHADGRVFMASRGRTAEGGCTITWLDITDAHRAEARAREVLNDAIQSLTVGLALYDPEMRFVLGNQRFAEMWFPAGITMPEPGESLGPIMERLIDADHVALPDGLSREAYVDLVLDRAHGFHRDMVIETKAGTFSCSSHQTGLGGFLIEFRDITEQLRAEAEVERQREAAHQNEKLSAMGELLAGVAHELNNPLSVVVGYAMMLQNNVTDPRLSRHVDNIAQSAERCSRIVKAFLAMARQRPAVLQRCSLNELMMAALDMVGHRLRLAGIHVDLDLDPDLPDVDADEDQLMQVFINLIVNAEQALTGHDGPRRVGLHSFHDVVAGKAVARISDSGPGIPEDALPRIFEPFYTTKDVGDGTGIGLAFCHRIVTSHGGRIAARSTPGKGARFYVRLALSEGAMPEPDTDEAPSGAGTCSVLVVDDEAGVAELVTDILTDAGYEVTTVNSAARALRLVAQQRFDAVLSDIKMPGMDGPAFYRRLEETEPELARRIGFMTGDTLSRSVADFLAESGQPHLEKPMTPVELLSLVSGLTEEQDAP